jgi:fatty-acyl-CoA synthase
VGSDVAKPAKPSQIWARALGNLAALEEGRWRSFPCLVDALAERFDAQPALVSAGETLTYRDLAGAKNAYAHWAAAQLTAPGEAICLFMGNSASYFAIWLGVIQAGGCAALININLRGEALIHSIASAGARTIVADAALLPLLQDIRSALPSGTILWLHGEQPTAEMVPHAFYRSAYPDDKVAEAPSALIGSDATALLIFTSGTTGYPKAARISHHRLLEWSLWFAGMMDTQKDDRLYNCLPMYHSTGGVAGIGGVLVKGGTVILEDRFSRRHFWTRIAERDCTIFLYIGELCRYLAHAPFDENETRHRLRLCIGNGLRADVWSTFQERFKIPAILEFYASTEGNVALYNCEGRPGAIGRVPGFLAHRFPTELIVCDTQTGEAMRGEDGRCIRCATGETGEAIGRIPGERRPVPGRFEGYTDTNATERKILRDVFETGDLWFRTGDLMRQDAAGFYYFVDRMGDTFRWKGENVSTLQVSETLCRFPGIDEAIVYGVAIDGEEGRACMAALITTPLFDVDALPAFAEQHLPPYARPMFLRLCKTIETTGTFKPIKARLIREGYDRSLVDDKVLVFDARLKTYVERKEAVLY